MSLPAWWGELKYFSPVEFDYAGMMSKELLLKLDNAREIAGIPFIITSSYRPGDTGAHGRGLAVDIQARGSKERKKLVKALDEAGFPRIGIYDRHVHGDIALDLPEGWWGGRSR